MKTHTTITLDVELKDRAKKKGLNISKICTDALKLALDEEIVLNELKEERRNLLTRVSEIEVEMQECKVRIEAKSDEMMSIDQGIMDAMGTLEGIFYRMGDVKQEQINFQASINSVPADELTEHWNRWVNENVEM